MFYSKLTRAITIFFAHLSSPQTQMQMLIPVFILYSKFNL